MAATKPLYKAKTFWAGIAALVTAAGGYFTGDMIAADSLELAAIALIGIFLRDAVRA